MQQVSRSVVAFYGVDLVAQARPRARWPKVIGVISIVLSAVFLVHQCFRVGLWLQTTDASRVIFAVLGMFLQFVLLAGGFLLGKRRAVGVTLHVAWAWITIALVGLVAMLTLVGYGDAAPHAREKMLPTVILVAASSGVMAIYPVFLLIWMSRRFVKREILT